MHPCALPPSNFLESEGVIITASHRASRRTEREFVARSPKVRCSVRNAAGRRCHALSQRFRLRNAVSTIGSDSVRRKWLTCSDGVAHLGVSRKVPLLL